MGKIVQGFMEMEVSAGRVLALAEKMIYPR